MKISGWGRYPQAETELYQPTDEKCLVKTIQQGSLIARGNGRSYGDSAIHEKRTVDMRGFRHFISFDPETGVLVAESGVMLSDIITTFLPRGWFPYVTPGTKYVTLGGAIAADVHGKNHHKEGSFGSYVHWIDLLLPDGTLTRCNSLEQSELFNWTIGGMGLTGIIIRASIQLKRIESAWIKQTTIPAKNLWDVFEQFEKYQEATYSVAWIDCLSKEASLGRSVLMLGEHAAISDLSDKQREDPLNSQPKKQFTIPFDFPPFALNRYSVTVFNHLYYQINRLKSGDTITDWDSYFYPLDSLNNWNRIYGRKGFTQFQCVLPENDSKQGIEKLLLTISDSRMPSFLAVLKQFGDQDSYFSFPMAGYTLALDFPMNDQTEPLMKKLHQITLDYGGRIYLAKDAHLTAENFRKSDDRVSQFKEYRKGGNFQKSFQSMQSNRLEL